MVTRREIIFVSVLLVGGIIYYFGYHRVGSSELPPPEANAVDLNYDVALQKLPGFYWGIDAESASSTEDVFFVTADLEFYRLTKTQVKYAREYIGSIDLGEITFQQDGAFKFFSYSVRPMPQAELPHTEQLLPLLEINRLCQELIKALNAEGLELSVRLDRDKPEFTDIQKALLQKLIEQKAGLVSYMKGRGYETLWVNDYLNERLYVLDGYFVIPAALTETPDTIVAGLTDGSYVPDSME
jgi:hypothetical protein